MYVWTSQNVTITQGSDLLKIFQDAQTASGFPMLRYFCSECGSNLFMRPGDKASTEMGLKIISYGCLNLEEGDGRWRELNSLLEVENNAESPSGPSAVRKEIFSDQRAHFVQIERRKTQPKL
jgi:hypothetical protein